MINSPARVVEIVGPAGAGKTSTYLALGAENPGIYLSNFPDVRKIVDAPFFIRYGLQIASALLGMPRRNGRLMTRREFAWLSILRGWPGVLKKESQNHRVILLDQGPVYLLTETFEFGPEFLRGEKAGEFRRDLYSRWANTLDTIVWLDAPDTDLQRRILDRGKNHIVKYASPETTFMFLAGYRKAYDRTITHLTESQKKLKVLRFDTSRNCPEAIANQLMLEFGVSDA